MRATIEYHDNSNNLPPIQVMVSLGGEDMSIKVGCILLYCFGKYGYVLDLCFRDYCRQRMTSWI